MIGCIGSTALLFLAPRAAGSRLAKTSQPSPPRAPRFSSCQRRPLFVFECRDPVLREHAIELTDRDHRRRRNLEPDQPAAFVEINPNPVAAVKSARCFGASRTR